MLHMYFHKRLEIRCLLPHLFKRFGAEISQRGSEKQERYANEDSIAHQAKDQKANWLWEVYEESKLQGQHPCSISSPGSDPLVRTPVSVPSSAHQVPLTW